MMLGSDTDKMIFAWMVSLRVFKNKFKSRMRVEQQLEVKSVRKMAGFTGFYSIFSFVPLMRTKINGK